MTRSKFAVGYIRCSTDMQKESPEQQRKEILEKAEKIGKTITKWFIDRGRSGVTFDRPEFKKLWVDVQTSPDYDTVIIYDGSRLGRPIDPEENARWRMNFKDYGIQLVSATSSVDPDSDFAGVVRSLEDKASSDYSKKLSELTLRGTLNNGIYSNGGTAPYGYVRIAINMQNGDARILKDGQHRHKTEEKVVWGLGDPDEVNTVKVIFQRKIHGIFEVLIAKELNDKNIPCPQRGRWRNKNQRWSAGTIRSIIENPSYYGARVYNRNSMSIIVAAKEKRPRSNARYPHYKNDPDQWSTKDGAHPAILSKEDWLRANKRKRPGRTGPRERTDTKFALRGLLKCKSCGCNFYGMTTKVKGYQYRNYVCHGYQAKRICPYCAVPGMAIEAHVESLIRDVLIQEKIIKAIEEIVEQIVQRIPDQIDEIRLARTARLEDIKTEERRLIAAIAQGYRDEQFREYLNELHSERVGIESELSDLVIEKSAMVTATDIRSDIFQFIADFGKDPSSLTDRGRRELFQKFVREMWVDSKEGVIECTIRRLPAIHPKIVQIEEDAHKKAAARLRIDGQLLNSGVAGTRCVF